VAVTLYRTAPAAAQLLSASGNRAFDRSVMTHFRDPAPAGPALPPLPPGLDSVRVQIGFGVEPTPGSAGIVRFAAQQAPAQLVRGSMRIVPGMRPTGSRGQSETAVKYDIDAAGRIDPASIEILSGVDRAFANAIAEGLAGATGTPATSNCRAVASSVVQKFRGR
jgi:outer membrane biosynthesis protein TonB